LALCRRASDRKDSTHCCAAGFRFGLFIKELPVELPIASAPIGIIMLKNRPPSPAVQRFIDCAREIAKPLAKKKI